MLDELGTRLVPWARIEVTCARNRPESERPPLPVPGDRVWFRRFDWDHDKFSGETVEPELAVVIAVQPVDDRTPVDVADGVPGLVRDPNLWQLIRNVHGEPLWDDVADDWVYRPAPDPWPWVDLQRDNDEWDHPRPVERTRESRLRGAAGWLPLDYRQRPERWRLPEDLLSATVPVRRGW